MSDDQDYELPIGPEDGLSEVGEKDFKWPSAEGYKVDPNWKPTMEKPLPALRCSYTRPDGTRCKKFGLRGTGGANTNGTSMCYFHGGALPSVKAMADAQVMAARMKLIDNAEAAVDTLLELTQPGTADQVRLGAVKEILDRAGLKGGPDLTVEVQHTVSYKDEIQKRLEDIKARKKAMEVPEDIIDAEEVTEVDNPDQT